MLVLNPAIVEEQDYILFLCEKEHLTSGELSVYIENKCPFLLKYLEERCGYTYGYRKNGKLKLLSEKVSRCLPAKGIKPIKARGPSTDRSILYWNRSEVDNEEQKLRSQCVDLLRKGQGIVKYKKYYHNDNCIKEDKKENVSSYVKNGWCQLVASSDWALDVIIERVKSGQISL